MLAHSIRTLATAVALALAAPALAGAGGPPATAGPSGPAGPGACTGTCTVAIVAPTPAEAADMTFVREEEKLARDLYLGFDEAWGIAPFAAIAGAEQRHMNAMLRMLVKYRLPDPVAGHLIGEFADADLQEDYAVLLGKGLAGPVQALRVGGLVEEVDIRDTLAAAARTAKPDLDAVYAALACGSRNHLRAFAAALRQATGEPYAAQYLTQAQVDAILARPVERCGRP